jgi:hypothetical protein
VHGVGSGETGTGLESTLRPAQGAAEGVYGSAKMENELEVRVFNESKEEAELLGAVLQTPMLDKLVRSTRRSKPEASPWPAPPAWQFDRDGAEFQVGERARCPRPARGG